MTPESERPASARGSSSAKAGVGLGLRWDFLEEVLKDPPTEVAFFEVSPENYLGRGGYYPAALERIREHHPIFTHGLTLSIGAIDEPDPVYLSLLKAELERLNPAFHSDHLCFASAGKRVLHELLPLKFCAENVDRVADRVRRLQGFLERPIALENITYYARLGHPELTELEFLNQVLDASGAQLLLDVNNVYVNAVNHGFDPQAFIAGLPLERVVEIHVAGHLATSSGLLLDTHGSPVADPVLDLLEWTLERTGNVPVLLERDNEVPALAELLSELAGLRERKARALARHAQHHAKSA